ncbi:glycosyl hydrolase family 97 [Dysgonomonas alginatilytica]|uniref:Glycosyl hydrolase family 97 n=1 Tax=Dysgonomonas alginatilytica TaxID=1605892 RepID=A0A2V3PQI1_9BACT|nr:glycoside hydrolase family 97 protein [Dysgonomonas alginatilytica]PXV66298.1 glycosyl hydrolase family 97 [Dysgonomonas alginatilytica]
MKNIIVGIIFILMFTSCLGKKSEWVLSSPDGNVTITVLNKQSSEGNDASLVYHVTYNGKKAIMESPLGIDREDEQFSTNLKLDSESKPILIDEKYTLKSGKKLNVHNYGNEQTLTFKNSNGKSVQLIMRAYNDGVAFRYKFPESDTNSFKVMSEKTGFALSTEGKAWIHPYDWNSRFKPSYEQYCENEIAIGTDSPNPKGWAFPMLFNTNGLWVMVTEAVLDGSYCATHISSTKDGLYKIRFAEKEEVIIPDDPEPVSNLPWATPWRVIAISNNLAGIVETNIVQNLNLPSVISDESWIKPGRSSWSWWSNGASARDYKTQIEYVDFTADMGWEYMLIDAGWPDMEGGTMEDVVKYANSKNVGVWLWYHSGAGRSQDTINSFNLMAVKDARKAELTRIQELGVKGIKVDFFDTDKQNIVKQYYAILSDAADHHIMVNFHGSSLPRGLERTYPNLMTTEAIKGAESFGRQVACDKAPRHNTTVPFTRNMVGSMDYTPVTFSNKIRQGVEAFNVTSYAHQLALSVIFESGVQNFADNYKSYESLPSAPLNFLKGIPAAWDETKLLDGYPGDYVVMARRKGDTWYIGAINGKNESREIELDLSFLSPAKNIEIISDGTERTQFTEHAEIVKETLSIHVLPYGGFVATAKP